MAARLGHDTLEEVMDDPEVEAVEVDAVEADAVEADARRETTRAVGNPQPKRISLFTQLKPDRSDISQGRFFLACRGLTPPPAL